jgi:hypothetical protein
MLRSSRVKNESGKPEYCRPTQRGVPACVVQTQRTRVPWSPRTAVGRVDYTLFGWRQRDLNMGCGRVTVARTPQIVR